MKIGLAHRRAGLLSAVLSVVLYHAPVSAAGGSITESIIGTGTVNADIWTFYCPAGGSFSARVDTTGQEMDFHTVGRSGLDPAFSVLDSTPAILVNRDNDVACTNQPLNGVAMGCPQTTDTACGVGTKHILGIFNNGKLPGGTYQLFLSVKNAKGVELTPKQIKLGGGPKPRLPSTILQQSPGAVFATPMVDDGSPLFLPNP